MSRSIEELQSRLKAERYVADRKLATAIFLMLALGRPLLLEREAGWQRPKSPEYSRRHGAPS